MKVLFNVNQRVTNFAAQNVDKNKNTNVAQEQNSLAPTSFKGSEATKSILQAQENMRVPKSVVGTISFKGNPDKHANQIASIASEYDNLDTGKALKNYYKKGGLGNVANEAATAFKEDGVDIRTFIPYHSQYKTATGDKRYSDGKVFVRYTNADGKVDFKFPEEEGKTVDTYELKDGEAFVILAGEIKRDVPQVDPDTKQPKIDKKTGKQEIKDELPAMMELERTDIRGSVPYIDDFDNDLAQKEDKFTLFKLKQPANDDGSKKPEVYVVYTEGLSKLDSPYTSQKSDNDGAYSAGNDREYADYTRAIIGKILPELNKEEFGNFNPAGIWLHDRFAFPGMLEASKRAADGDDYFSGLRMHATYHNPGRAYQGHYDNPLDFIKVTGMLEILDTIAKENPKAMKTITECIKLVGDFRKDPNNLGDKVKNTTVEEIINKDGKNRAKELEEIFEPYLGQFKDEAGTYNMSLIPHVAAGANENNFTHGTVSMNYGKEMVNPDTPEIASKLTSILAKDADKMVNITNGSAAVNLKLDGAGNPKKNLFGNTPCLNNNLEGYTLLAKENIKTADDLDKVKKANAKWAINTISEAFKEADAIAAEVSGEEEGEAAVAGLGASVSKEEKEEARQKAINEVKSQARQEAIRDRIFAADKKQDDKDNKATVLGSLSPYEEGDKLFIGWGRADTQKGMPISLEAFKQFFMAPEEEVSEETKKHTKVILGAGIWKDGTPEFEKIKQEMKDIAKIDGGKYANNVVYVNGFMANQLVACADYSIITSRYEPCGITPLESYSGGTPVISNATGGSPDFIKTEGEHKTGFMTEHAFFVKPELLTVEGEKVPVEPDKNKEEYKKDPKKYQEDLNKYEIAKDDYRIKALGLEAKKCIEDAHAMSDEEYKNMAFECYNQKIGWRENAEYNNGRTANERYFEDVFGIKKTENGIEEISEDSHPTEQMKFATGDKTLSVKDGREEGSFEKLRQEAMKGSIGSIEDEADEEITKDETTETTKTNNVDEGKKSEEIKNESDTPEGAKVDDVNGTNDTNNVKDDDDDGNNGGNEKDGNPPPPNTGKIIAIGAAIVGAVAAIGIGIKKFFGGKDKKAKKVGSKKATPKAPKPTATKTSAVKPEVTVEAPKAPVQTEAKPKADDFAKYFK